MVVTRRRSDSITTRWNLVLVDARGLVTWTNRIGLQQSKTDRPLKRRCRGASKKKNSFWVVVKTKPNQTIPNDARLWLSSSLQYKPQKVAVEGAFFSFSKPASHVCTRTLFPSITCASHVVVSQFHERHGDVIRASLGHGHGAQLLGQRLRRRALRRRE